MKNRSFSTEANNMEHEKILLSIQTNQLLDQTNILLDQPTMSDEDLIAVLTDWLHYHNENDNDTASQLMQRLVEHWMATTTSYSTNRPFWLLLQRLANEGRGHRAALVLDTWLCKLAGHLSLAPTLPAFHLVLEAHAHSHSAPCQVDAMLDLVTFLEQSYNMTTTTVETYAWLLVGMERECSRLPTHPWTEHVQTALKRMDHHLLQTTPPKDKDVATYHYVRGYARAMSWARKKRQWKLGEEAYANIRQVLQPQVVQAAAEHQLPKYPLHLLVGELAYDYLRILFRLSEYQRLENDKSNKKRHSPKDDRVDEAIHVLDMLSSLELENLPWAKHHTIVIEMWGRSYNRPGLLEFLKNLEQKRLAEGKPVIISWYSLVLYHANQLNLPRECEEWLERLMELHREGLVRGVSDAELTRCWNHVLAVVPPFRVSALWTQFQAANIQPDLMTFNHVLWGLARNSHHTSSARAALDAEGVLRTMVDAGLPPQASHYGAVMTAWTKSSAWEAATRADALLLELEEKYAQSQQEWDEPRMDLYTNVIAAYGRSKTPWKALSVFERIQKTEYGSRQLDVVVYGALMNALSQCKNQEAAEHAEALLLDMEHSASFLQHGQGYLRPNAHLYTSCIKAWAFSGAPDAALRAEKLFEHLEASYRETRRKDLQPDPICYSSLVDVWARSSHQDAGIKAEGWLRRFQEAGGKINRFLYTNVINAWWRSKSDQPNRALALLQEMKEESANGNLDAAPDNRTYTSVIQTIAASSWPDKALQSWKVMEEMIKEYRQGGDLKPTVYPFTAVLNACAFTRDPEYIGDAQRVALLVLNEMQVLDVAPNHVTYRTVLSVFVPRSTGGQGQDEVEKVAKVIFDRCCQDGQVHPEVLEILRKYHPKIYNRIPQDRITGNSMVPPEWTINIQEQSR